MTPLVSRLGALLLALMVSPIASATIAGPFDRDGGRVTVYTDWNGMKESHVVFAYGRLAARVATYLAERPGDAGRVTLDVALHTLTPGVFIDVADEGASPTRGHIGGKAFGKAERFLDLLVRAAGAGAKVRLLYQNPAAGKKDAVAAYLEKKAAKLEGKGALKAIRVTWPDGAGAGSLNSRFMLVSHFAGDTRTADTKHLPRRSGVYVGSGAMAVPRGKKPTQSGVLVDGNQGLHEAYRRYFGLLWKHAAGKKGLTGFRRAVAAGHKGASLNYDVGVFAATFYPMPADAGAADGWAPDFNPVARYVETINASSGINRAAFLAVTGRLDSKKAPARSFGATLGARLPTAHKGACLARYGKDSGGETPAALKANCSNVRGATPTDCDNFHFVWSGSGGTHYVVVTGSAEARTEAFAGQANHQLVIRETGRTHDVYRAFARVLRHLL